MNITGCECDGPKNGEKTFFCDRHQCKKTKHFHKLCSERPKYFELWEKEEGPCLGKISEKKPLVLGDNIIEALEIEEITINNIEEWIKNSHGCRNRKEKLNRLDEWADFVLNQESNQEPTQELDKPEEFIEIYNLKNELLSKDIFSRGVRYFNEREIWKKAGKPLRSDEEIFRIFTEICSECEYFNKNMCKICGCRLKSKGTTMNKIAWSTTNCPMSQPKWTAEIETKEIKKIEQEMFQVQTKKQENGLKMKEVSSPIVTQPPKKKSGCCDR